VCMVSKGLTSAFSSLASPDRPVAVHLHAQYRAIVG
jgi:hypothetical protein